MDINGSTTFLWFLIFLPGIFYPMLCFTYRRTLQYKYLEIENIMTQGNSLQRYIRAFEIVGTDSQKTIKCLFEFYYHWKAYILPSVVIVFVTTVAGLICVVRMGIPMGLPNELGALIARMPSSIVAGLVGAYTWGVYDSLRRYHVIDLSPISLQFIWLRIVIAFVLGYGAGLIFKGDLEIFAAFGLGAFPVKTLKDFVKGEARKRFNMSGAPVPAEEPTLHKIQGLSKEINERLLEEGIYSTENLANADPVKLLLRTNFEWKVILDIIDQAILYCYVGDKIENLRPMGIRGSIELAELGHRLQDPDSKDQAEKLCEEVAQLLGRSGIAVKNLIQTIIEDPQVDLIVNLWGETYVGSSENQVS